MGRLQLKPILTWSSFYPGRPLSEDPLKYFRDFELDDVVNILIWVKGSMINPEFYSDFARSLTNRMDPYKKMRIEQALMDSAITNPIVIDRILVEVFRTHSCKTSDRNVDEAGFEDQLFDLILYFNDVHYETHMLPLEGGSIESMWALALGQAWTGLDNVDYVRTANIKYLIFLNFLRKHFGKNFEHIENSFKERTKLSGFNNVFQTVIRFYLTTETGAGSKQVNPNFAPELCKDLEQLGMVVDQEELPDPNFTIGQLAARPYYKSKGNIFVISRSNFAFALEKSWPFFLYQNSDLKNFLPGKGKYNDFQALIGKDYIEDHYLNPLFSSLSKPGFRWIRPTETYMPDGCYVINESTVVLFEFKSSPLHFNVIAEQNLQGLKKFLDENFAAGKKGAPQLANAVKHLSASSQTAYEIKTPVNKITVYPVIIYTDMNLGMLGVNDYVDQHFQNKLGNDGGPFKQVMPLTMVHADFFTENLLLFEKDRSLFKESLDQYLKYRRKKLASYAKTDAASDYLAAHYQFNRYVLGYKLLYRVPQIDVFRNLIKVFGLK